MLFTLIARLIRNWNLKRNQELEAIAGITSQNTRVLQYIYMPLEYAESSHYNIICSHSYLMFYIIN